MIGWMPKSSLQQLYFKVKQVGTLVRFLAANYNFRYKLLRESAGESQVLVSGYPLLKTRTPVFAGNY